MQNIQLAFSKFHNTCITLDRNICPSIAVYNDILEFLERTPIYRAITERTVVYSSHFCRFWSAATVNAEKTEIRSAVRVGNEDVEFVVTE